MDLDLKFVGDECLTKRSETIDEITESVRDLASAMKTHMVQWNGIGLAAPQVGHNIRMMVIRIGTGQIVELINPRISWTSDKRITMEEGCLSIPDNTRTVERPSRVRVKFQTIDGDFKYWCLHNMDARVFLHEYDHLEGILMTEKV